MQRTSGRCFPTQSRTAGRRFRMELTFHVATSIGELFPTLPDGLVFAPGFLTEAEHDDLIRLFQTLTWGSVQMRGVTAKRRVNQFGWHYSFESFRLTPAKPAPPELDAV